MQKRHPVAEIGNIEKSQQILLSKIQQCAHTVFVRRHLHRQTHASATAANSNKKQTAVVGVGLGGLTAASILQKHGFSAVVFERDASQHSRRQGGVLDLHPESGETRSCSRKHKRKI